MTYDVREQCTVIEGEGARGGGFLLEYDLIYIILTTQSHTVFTRTRGHNVQHPLATATERLEPCLPEPQGHSGGRHVLLISFIEILF